MRGELALMLCVFGVTAALISYAPPIDAASGPFSVNTTIGPAELEMTVEPAKVGLNTIHLYLIDAKSGSPVHCHQGTHGHRQAAGQGHRPAAAEGVAGRARPLRPSSSAVLSPGGTWEIEIVDRVSEFEQFTRVGEGADR